MKKNARFITGVIDLIIVISAFIIPIWDYTRPTYFFGYKTGGYTHDNITTIELFDESMYYDEILHIFLVIAFVLLIVSAVLSFTNKKLNISKIIQGVSSIVVAVMYLLVHIEVFSLLSDYRSCELSAMGFLVVLLCIANAAISFKFVNEEKIENNIEKEEANVL